MKMNIQITKIGKGFLETDEEIVNIDICNGHWKYWDTYTEEKVSLTINTIRNAHYINLPVKNAYGFTDVELYNETGEIQTEKAIVRTYNTLLDYLNCRIGNVKEDYKKGHYGRYYKDGRTFNAVLFKEPRRCNDICESIPYELDGEIEVKITVVE